MPENKQKTKKTRRLTPENIRREIERRSRRAGVTIRRVANLSPQAQGINLAERRLRAINEEMKKKSKKR